ncbi:LAFE_0B08746g1_1 [Lachancea fermentati]|uniref:LAFE_0B08746g1_1 n=1 Tax=Lachancea fermentati TaxID=4955 RepID=A0A1G4M8G5_LACFM|nr:LAFE_0B08746g1_1 [Lachancea fermentati]
MDDVDDILNSNQVAEEEEEEEEELDEDIVDAAGSENRQEQDQEQDQDGDHGQDEDEDMDANGEDNEDDENDNEDDEDEDDQDEDEEDDIKDDGGDSNDEDMDTDNVKGTEGELDAQLNEQKKPSSAFDKVHEYYTQLYHSAKLAESYTIYPTAAIPIQTHVHALAMSKGLKYLFLGGEDGYIRKYDFLNTIEGKLSLTILQKHSLVESISNAGILLSYWENEVPQRRKDVKVMKNGKEYDPIVSPVHALEVQSECLFVLSGLQNGGITMQGCRFLEGQIAHCFSKHKGSVNQLKLNNDETRFISSGWDRQILEWDLNSGKCANEFLGASAQVSSLEFRPLSSSVDLNEIAGKEDEDQVSKEEDDEDVDSLFGDEAEVELRKTTDETSNAQQGNQNPAGSPSKSNNLINEISKETLRIVYDESTFLTSCTNGSIQIWDRRDSTKPSLKLHRGAQVPPWCMSACWSMDGDRIYVGRRNAVVEEFDLKMGSNPSKTLKFPSISGPVSCVRTMPNNKHVLCASNDNIRLYDVTQYGKSSKIPFLIVPGHHGGTISNLYVDPTCRFLISTSGNRGWQGNSTDTTLIYDIDVE